MEEEKMLRRPQIKNWDMGRGMMILLFKMHSSRFLKKLKLKGKINKALTITVALSKPWLKPSIPQLFCVLGNFSHYTKPVLRQTDKFILQTAWRNKSRPGKDLREVNNLINDLANDFKLYLLEVKFEFRRWLFQLGYDSYQGRFCFEIRMFTNDYT